jgi:hypothetical protein
VNRNCSPAKEISKRTGISARRIEAWTIQRLGPIPQLAISEQIPHFLELRTLVRRGRSNNADLVARRLAAHGFVCERLRTALFDEVDSQSPDSVNLNFDLSTEESTDEAFRNYDVVARAVASTVNDAASPIRPMVKMFRRNISKAEKNSGNNGEQVFRSALVSLLHFSNGGEILDEEAVAVMFGMETSNVESDALEFMAKLNVSLRDIDDAYTRLRLEDVVTMSKWIRDRIHIVAEFLGVANAPDSKPDDLSTYFSPMALLVLERSFTVIEDAPAIFKSLEIPPSLIPLSTHVFANSTLSSTMSVSAVRRSAPYT